jgi:hypothetical protein
MLPIGGMIAKLVIDRASYPRRRAGSLPQTPGNAASDGEPHSPDLLKHLPKRQVGRHAHGSIRIQEGQPRNLSMLSTLY